MLLQVRKTREELFTTLSQHIGKPRDVLEKDISRPLYLSPYDAVEYGVIDKVLEADGATASRSPLTSESK